MMIKKGLLIGAFILSFNTFGQTDLFQIAKQMDIYNTVFKEINLHYVDEINFGELTDESINDMLNKLDPYTRFYDEQGIERVRIQATGEYAGTGIITVFRNDEIIIKEILKDSPAEQTDLKPGDRIIKIDGTSLESYNEDSVDDLLNGLPDTQVLIEIRRQQQTKEITLKRRKIVEEPIPYYSLLEDEIGYISFIRFNEQATGNFREAFLDLKDQGMKKLIIDLRDNPGGLLNSAVQISNMFIEKEKLVVSTKGKATKWNQEYLTKKPPLDLEIPLAILVNRGSASASEIVAGSLQDYDRAVIIGKKSFGKGLVQRYQELPYGTQMKITISKYYTPSGRCIQELDYANRDEEGKIPKFSDTGQESFKTSNGRIVYGGGGIMPDVEVGFSGNEITELLLNSEAFFNFISDYFNKNKSSSEPEEFNLSNQGFENLKNYLNEHKDELETLTEKKLKETRQKAIEEKLLASLNESYKQLQESIHKEKIKLIEEDKGFIINRLTEEIVKHYYYMEGLYRYRVANDIVIKEAKTILKDKQQYNRLLKK